jgi:hypothetical protein
MMVSHSETVPGDVSSSQCHAPMDNSAMIRSRSAARTGRRAA